MAGFPFIRTLFSLFLRCMPLRIALMASLLMLLPYYGEAAPRPAIALVHLLLPPDGTSKVEPTEWVRCLDKARDGLEARHIPTVVSASLPNDSRVFREAAELEPEVLIATSPLLYEKAREAAKAAPNTAVLACTDETENNSMSGFQVRSYEAHYLAGLLAGTLSESGTLGYLANDPQQSEASRRRNANAFTLGAQAARTDVKVLFAPGKASEGEMDSLLEAGADIINLERMQPSLAERLNKRSIRYIGTEKHPGDPLCLATPVWEWENVFGDILTQVRFGIWRAQNLSYGMREGVVRLNIGPAVPQETRKRLRDAQAALGNDTVAFTGHHMDSRTVSWNVQGLDVLPERHEP